MFLGTYVLVATVVVDVIGASNVPMFSTSVVSAANASARLRTASVVRPDAYRV